MVLSAPPASSQPPPRRDDLVISFGDAGLWTIIDGTFSQLHPSSAEHVAVADLDHNGIDDLAIDFGANGGVWLYRNNVVWDEVDRGSGPTPLAIADLDNDGYLELIMVAAVFQGVAGVNIEPASPSCDLGCPVAYAILHRNDVLDLKAGQLDGVPVDDLVLNFPSDGIWIYRNRTSWEQLHSQRAQAMLVGDFEGYGLDQIAVGFANGFGTWLYSDFHGWRSVHALSAQHIAAGDFDGNGITDFVFDFGPGYGLWIYDNFTSWRQLHPMTARNLVTADLDGNGVKDIVVDFGPGAGIWVFLNNQSWYQLTALSAGQIAVAHLK